MRSLAPLLLCIALASGSTAARAQALSPPPLPESPESSTAKAPPPQAPGDDAVTAPPLVPAAPDAVPQPRRSGPRLLDRELTPPAEYNQAAHIVLGTLLGTVGVLAGAIVGYSIAGQCDPFESTDCGGDDLAAIVAGITLGVTLPVYGLGQLLDGHGTFLATLVGAAVGAGLSTVSSFVVDNGVLTYLLFPLTGAFVGFITSHGWNRPDKDSAGKPPSGDVPRWQRFSRQGAAPSIQVAFGATRGGGLVGGLVGRF